ncbi:F1 sector of membrane-bound ATP synthase, epsilon subunit [Legionella quinlivanii]|uniref:ATP synthase epsilon chain n=1 Tax=Legionella quinlivanii TaxID=45073 RepID=A0A0W0Y4Z8_9GAMM|nr:MULTISPECIES: F0F1 ATP synthase subunit epsilon [Legionella]KTD52008.1 F1 sector of membrane-bound ATP synthase, epsilon subunit [Legionella quinlivanii]MCE3046293.1 F0F1 ATP synthase subunit epsilon [Legionella sp. 16cNR16C]MCW8452271.1 F0F1 ATP synthase subunit epsilon [Legionella quinlivanii]RAP37652.1 F0F1 ATP synthase subunit epsilon [Legionella quinlivanii]SEF87423.1 F-type H+-transporting ATPase subunit epsilon [Legionella quinlivanii DSM 21216]
MAITTHLDIVSAEREIFSGVVEMVVATGELGEIGITPGHAPLLTVLKPGEIRITHMGGTQEVYYVSGGMLEVQPFYVTVLADEVERAESLDEAAALAAKTRAEEAIANKNADIDYSMAATELARAVAQIRAIQKVRKNLK